MSGHKDRIRVHIEGKEFSVVGGEFREMLAAVKQINGRRFVSELKVWQLPGTVEEVQRQLDISGYQLEGGSPVTTDDALGSRPPVTGPTGDRIQIVVAGQRLAVVGGSFQEMLATVKKLPGRRFDGETKTWEIPSELALIKGMIEAAGFQLEGAENIPLGPVPPMEPPDFLDESSSLSPSPFEPPTFFDDEETPPFEPPDWWDDMLPPPVEDHYDPAELMAMDDQSFPVETESPGPIPAATSAPAGDRIRIQVGETPLVVSGGSFQAMLTAVKRIPGRRFNPEKKVWQIPDNVTLESVRQTISAAGFVLTQE